MDTHRPTCSKCAVSLRANEISRPRAIDCVCVGRSLLRDKCSSCLSSLLLYFYPGFRGERSHFSCDQSDIRVREQNVQVPPAQSIDIAQESRADVSWAISFDHLLVASTALEVDHWDLRSRTDTCILPLGGIGILLGCWDSWWFV